MSEQPSPALQQEPGSSVTGVTLGSYTLRVAAWAQATSLAFVAAAEVMAMGTPVTSPSHPTAAMMTSTSK
ncbi:hypothetical protein CHLRE_01g050624v5 [Chlamydomonas reinhardtii]|uniref:Uncharacterized protein n=1 Tax=Chlamydomonas reinhardtii TaxID=3055 RepID=A0A2K3E809_CHLRE|nr:uncharacterized protein CHLRE_01g050624v5 [Chlamydomonas reinhardtii]PNW88918.1 hypothetical protein CHLRE_01g050624v5 [Chlamydomonas reinhardtii]